MKNQLVLIFLIVSLISCDSDKEIDMKQCPEKWQLVGMSGGIANTPPITGSDMPWQEWYLLYPNATFSKTREQDNVVTEQEGTYAIITLSDGKYLELLYESDNDLIGNCSTETKELVKINSKNELTGASWQACDGPGLYYRKVKYNCVEH